MAQQCQWTCRPLDDRRYALVTEPQQVLPSVQTARSTIRPCRATVGQNIPLLWLQIDFDFNVGQSSPRAHLLVVGMLRIISETYTDRVCPLFYSVLVSVSVFMALSTVFHSIDSPDNSPFSHSVLLVLFLPYWSFQLYIFL